MMLADWGRGMKPLLARVTRRSPALTAGAEPDAAEQTRIEHNVFIMQQTYSEKLCEISRAQAEIAACKLRAASLPPGDVAIDALVSEISMRTCELEQLRTDALDVQEVLRQNRAYLGLMKHEQLCQCLRLHSPGAVENISVRVKRVAELSQCQRDDAADMHMILNQAARLVLRQGSPSLSALDEQIRGEIALIREQTGPAPGLAEGSMASPFARTERCGIYACAGDQCAETDGAAARNYDAPILLDSDAVNVCDYTPRGSPIPSGTNAELTECTADTGESRTSTDMDYAHISDSDINAACAGGIL